MGEIQNENINRIWLTVLYSTLWECDRDPKITSALEREAAGPGYVVRQNLNKQFSCWLTEFYCKAPSSVVVTWKHPTVGREDAFPLQKGPVPYLWWLAWPSLPLERALSSLPFGLGFPLPPLPELRSCRGRPSFWSILLLFSNVAFNFWPKNNPENNNNIIFPLHFRWNARNISYTCKWTLCNALEWIAFPYWGYRKLAPNLFTILTPKPLSPFHSPLYFGAYAFASHYLIMNERSSHLSSLERP